LSNCGIPTFLDQQNLMAGQNWPQALERALKDSCAVAVFVGAEIGRWQWPEIGFALDRQANNPQFPVIPVLLDGADTSRSFLFLNTWVDLRGQSIHESKSIQRLVNALSKPEDSSTAPVVELNPYRGLEFFDEAHAPFFFGRETFIDELVERLTQQRKNFVAVIGASGSGKSSVVRAGLIPQLRRRRPPNETWDVAVFTPGAKPWLRLANALGPLRFPEKSDTELDIEIDKLARALNSGEISLGSLLDRILLRQGQMHRLLLIVDQLEELFTLTPQQERSVFIQELISSLAVKGIVLVPTLRADFYGQAIESNRQLSDLLGQEQVTLGRLNSKELHRVVVDPAHLAKLDFDPGLPELLLSDAGNEPGNLPLLQHALLELYVHRQGNRLTNKAYQAIGGIRQSIAKAAEREFKRWETKDQGPLVRRIFTQLVRLARADEGQEDTRRRVPIATLPPEAKPIIDEFASYQFRLLVKASERMANNTADKNNELLPSSEHETVEVAHEALIREWTRLKDWLNEDRGFYLWRQRLDQAIRDYEEHGEHLDYLLQGPQLKEAEGKLSAPMPEPLSEPQNDFIQASLKERDRIKQEAKVAEEKRLLEKQEFEERERKALKEAAVQERRARTAAERAKQVSWMGTIISIFIASIAIYLYWEADEQRIQAQNEKNRAEKMAWNIQSNELITKAENLFYSNPDQSILLGLAAQSISDTQKVETYLRYALENFNTNIVLRRINGFISTAKFSPDGKFIITIRDDSTVHLWEAISGKELAVLRGHDGIVNTALFSPDGNFIITASWDRTARLWEVASGKEVAVLRGHDDDVFTAQFSPDGKYIITASGDHTVRLWEVASRKELLVLRGHDRFITTAQFSSDEKAIITASYDKTVRVWEVASGKEVAVLRGHNGPVTSAQFSPDGKSIITVSYDNTIRLWKAPLHKKLTTLREHNKHVTTTQFSPNGKSTIIPSEDSTARVWEISSSKEVTVLRGHKGNVYSAKFSPDGKSIITVSSDKTTRLWEVASGMEVAVLRGHDGPVNSAQFSSDGEFIVTASDDSTARVWEVTSGKELAVLRGHNGPVTTAQFSPDGKSIITVSYDNTIRLWKAPSHKELTILQGHNGPVTTAQFSPDGKYIITASEDSTARVWEITSGKELAVLRGHNGPVTSAQFSPDGKFIVTASEDSTARLWEATERKELVVLRGHNDPITSAQFSPDGKYIITTSEDSTARLWEVTVGKELAVLRGHNDTVTTAKFSLDGKYIITASDDSTARLWEVATGKILAVLLGHIDTITTAQFSPNGKYIITASEDSTVRVWKFASGKEVAILRGHEDTITLAYSSFDGKYIITASYDNTARIWEAASGKALAILRGHNDPITSAQFSPDGKYIITASYDNTIRLWEAVSGKELVVLEGHHASVTTVHFSPNGKLIISASKDGTASLWQCTSCRPIEEIITELTKRVGRNLTEDEQRRFGLLDRD
jgi:WD40 repeat protein